MNKVIPFPKPLKVHDEACEWLARLDAGTSEKEKEEFALWIGSNPRHLEVLVEVASIWDQMSVLAELSEIFPLDAYSPQSAKRWRRRGFLGTVALLLCFIAIGGFLTFPKKFIPTSNSYVTAVGEQSTIELQDGSTVVMNTNTSINVVYSKTERKINLAKGEALFNVEKDESRPFRVYVGSRVVEAIGTAFTVQRGQQNDVEVMVTEGVVNIINIPEVITAPEESVSPDDLELAISLSAGEYAAVDDENDAGIQVRSVDESEVQERLSWRDGMLLFEGDPLEQVLREVGRYTLTRLEAAPSVRNVEVYGIIQVGDIEGLVATMRQNFQIDARQFGEEYILFVEQNDSQE